MKRVFIAIKIVGSDQLIKLAEELKLNLAGERIKWVETGNIHLTLTFLGNMTGEQVEEVKVLTGKVCSQKEAFSLVLRNVGLFRNINDPRVIWIGTDESKPLRELRASIAEALAASALFTDDRPFKPHITLGRPRSISNPESLERVISLYRDRMIHEQPVGEVLLFESILDNRGPVYMVLGRFPLG